MTPALPHTPPPAALLASGLARPMARAALQAKNGLARPVRPGLSSAPTRPGDGAAAMSDATRWRHQGTGVAAYDKAAFSSGLPGTSNVLVARSMSSVLQRRPAETSADPMQVEVPPSDDVVLIVRLPPPRVVQRFRIAGRAATATVGADHHILIPAQADSWWESTPQGVGGWFHLHFSQALMGEAAAEHRWDLGRPLVGRDTILASLARVAKEMTEAPIGHDGLAWDTLARLTLMRLMDLTDGSERTEHRGGLSPWQERRARAHIAENLARSIPLDELAGLCGLSTFHFARCFARTVGEPPHRFQARLRVEEACRLLQGTDLGVTEIALNVGFGAGETLSRAMRRLLGVTPREYRATARA